MASSSFFGTITSSPTKASVFSLPVSVTTLPSFPRRRATRVSVSANLKKDQDRTASRRENPSTFSSKYAPNEARSGADILVEALERQGVDVVFAYPGGASMEIHQALTRSNTIRNVLPRHEQGGIFAAEGYARSSGKPGICIATSGPGAMNLVTGLADAIFDSVPLIAITGQVRRRMIGTMAFQETPVVEVTRTITKHNYIVMEVGDIPRIVQEAFFLATSVRPGPVLIDVPKDVQQQFAIPNWEQPMRLPLYMSTMPKPPKVSHLEQILRLVSESKRPVLYVGGGCVNSSEELRRFVELTGIPVASTFMGLGSYPCNDEESSLQMLGMHGTVFKKPRQWLSSGGQGAMGFGLPAAMGAAIANPGAVVVDIDGDGSFIMNIQELATIRVENLPVKVLLINNQHLGMVLQWEDHFYAANRADSFLGDPANPEAVFPDMLLFAASCGIPAARVTRREDLREAIQTMLDTPGPFLLDVVCPHQDHVLPLIPSGGTFKDIIV
ncbi:hypothetical protein F2Q69_00060146 [Brassica cretica]|uniref:Acetolactate synthase n=1 Tax=Brassica cretica TaxID=69181 RepID=A0A8S9REC6_BRACR|nr:hypothetical protein F2Q69_00060146 [Brassica cretica]